MAGPSSEVVAACRPGPLPTRGSYRPRLAEHARVDWYGRSRARTAVGRRASREAGRSTAGLASGIVGKGAPNQPYESMDGCSAEWVGCRGRSAAVGLPGSDGPRLRISRRSPGIAVPPDRARRRPRRPSRVGSVPPRYSAQRRNASMTASTEASSRFSGSSRRIPRSASWSPSITIGSSSSNSLTISTAVRP